MYGLGGAAAALGTLGGVLFLVISSDLEDAWEDYRRGLRPELPSDAMGTYVRAVPGPGDAGLGLSVAF